MLPQFLIIIIIHSNYKYTHKIGRPSAAVTCKLNISITVQPIIITKKQRLNFGSKRRNPRLSSLSHARLAFYKNTGSKKKERSGWRKGEKTGQLPTRASHAETKQKLPLLVLRP